MDHEDVLEIPEGPQHGHAGDGVVGGAPAGVAHHGCAHVGAEEFLGDDARVETGYCGGGRQEEEKGVVGKRVEGRGAVEEATEGLGFRMDCILRMREVVALGLFNIMRRSWVMVIGAV